MATLAFVDAVTNEAYSLVLQYSRSLLVLRLVTPVMCYLTLILLAGHYMVIPMYRSSKRALRRFFGPYVYSLVVHYCSTMVFPLVRSEFQHVDLPTQKVSKHHTHPSAASDRTSMAGLIDRIIRKCGYVPYSVSMSGRDLRAENMGDRLFHMAKDLAMPFRNDRIGKTNIIKLVDVDYYLHMNDYLAYGVPIIMYTFCPRSVAGSLPDASYTIVNDEVFVDVNGGAKYSHMIWDYETDSMVSDHWWGSTVWLVESRTCHDVNRKLVALFPVRYVYSPLGWMISGYRLVRRRFTFGNINFSKYQQIVADKLTCFISMGRPGDRVSFVLPETVYHTAVAKCSISKDPSISDVERLFREDKVEEPHFAAALFIVLWKFNKDAFRSVFPILSVTPYSGDTITYQALGPLVTEEGKPSGREIGKNFTDGGGVAPARSYNNDVACVQGRIEDVKNQVVKVPPFYLECREEFVEHLIPSGQMWTGCPWSEQEVEAKQCRPTQRALAAIAKPFMNCGTFLVKSFQKAESYAKVCAPRNISQTPTDHRLRYASYIYPLTSVLKKFDWYAFGRTPAEITQKVQDVAVKCDTICPTDFSKFDGTHSKFLCEFELMLLLRFFGSRYHEEVAKLSTEQYYAKATTKNKVRYNTEFSRLSGSSDTSTFNTADNALVSYIALRVTGHSKIEAFDKLGFYGGDDGLTGDVDPTLFERVCARLGLTLKAEKIERGNPVPFLGRMFLDPWTTGESICDVGRRVRCLHITTASKQIADNIVLMRKAEGYYVTDSHTPFISNWCRAIFRILKGTNTQLNDAQEAELSRDLSYFAKYDKKEQFLRPALVSDRAFEVAAASLQVEVNRLVWCCSELIRSRVCRIL